MAEILLVDDDASLLRVTERQLAGAGHQVRTATSAIAALEAFAAGAFDLVVTDVQMPEMDGLTLLTEIRRRDPVLPVLVITAYGTVEKAVEAMKAGAADFLEKPFRREVLLHAVGRALEMRGLVEENRRLRRELSDRFSTDDIVAESAAMREVLRTAGRVADSDVPALLVGESGTGKELVARAIHARSPRADRPFVPVNLAAVPEGLVESELFGHEKGAFTGAERPRKGCFLEATGGTLFLDEIGDLRTDLQAKLLRVLQDGEVRPVGAERTVRTDARLVSATNRDLDAALGDRSFREDLYFRIAVVTIELPPLRDRPEDVEPLLDRFLARKGAARIRPDPEFVAALRRYRWPGNVRELLNVLERALVLREDPERLTVGDLPADVAGAPPPVPGGFVLPPDGLDLADVEQELIRQALERTEGNRTHAARLLGITRQTLLYRLEKYGLR